MEVPQETKVDINIAYGTINSTNVRRLEWGDKSLCDLVSSPLYKCCVNIVVAGLEIH